MAKQPIIINVTTEKPLVEITNFVPSPSGSFGSALTAIQADTAITSSYAFKSDLALVASSSLGGTGSYSGSFAGDGSGLTGIIASSTQSTADTASYVAGSNVDGQVGLALLAQTASFVESSSFAETASLALNAENATSASHALVADAVPFGGVTGKPTLVSESIQVDHDATTNFLNTEHFLQSAITEVGTVVTGDVDAILPVGTLSASAQITGQLDVAGITGSLEGTASFADVAQTLLGSVANADTASYVAGADVDGIVELATSASDVAFGDVRDTPTLVSASIQVDHDGTTNFAANEHFLQSAITEVGTVVTGDVDAILPVGTLSASAQITGQLDVTGMSGSFTGSFIGDGTGITGIVAETASYVAGADVDGPVAAAVSASDVAYDDVRDKPTLISSSAQFDVGDDFIAGQVDAVGVSGSFLGTGQGITGIVLADSATLALNVSGSDVVGSVDTASYVAGGNVDGAVALLDGEATGTLTGSFIGGINLTDTSDMSGSTFAHQVGTLIGQSSNFTISLDDNQIQQFAISASLEFDVEGGRVGGIYSVHFINSGAFDVTWPIDMKYNSGSAITTSIASGALDIYTMTLLPDGTYASLIFGQFIS